MRFIVSTEGHNKLKLQESAQAFVDSLWVPAHLTAAQAEDFAIDQFRRAVVSELELIEVKAVDLGNEARLL